VALNEIRAVALPYCLERQPDGRYVILNRHYKPLGFMTHDRVDYNAYPIAVKFKRLTRATATKLSARGNDDLEKIWLYDDASVPTTSARNMQQYLERLKVLMSLKLDTQQ
jgi:hypothetical protein